MPSTSVKNLYLGKNINDLDLLTKVEFSKLETQYLLKFASKLIEAADKCYLDEDEEKAYVQYNKYVELILAIGKRQDFEKESSDGKRLYLLANNAITKAENLKKSLLRRYKILEEANCQSKNEKNDLMTALHFKKSDVISPLETATVEKPIEEKPTAGTSNYTITSEDLFTLFTSMQSTFVIMDTRSEEEFCDSRIKHSKCVNVPRSFLVPGTTAAKLESLLPKESLSMWYKRGEMDKVILVDLDSKDDKSESTQLRVLKEAMCKWDQHCPLKSEPLVLEGGYQDWVLKYPMYTTHPISINYSSKSEYQPKMTDLSDVEYPNLDENPPNIVKNNKENLNGPGTLFTKKSIPDHIIDSNVSMKTSGPRNTNSAPAVDRKSKPNLEIKPKFADGQRKTSSAKITSTKITPTPNNNKAGGSDEIKNAPTEARRTSEERIVKENLETAEKICIREKEIENMRLRKQLEAEESMRAELQIQEEQLIDTIRKLEAKLEIKDSALKKMKLNESKHFSTKKEEITQAELKREKLQAEVVRLRELRKKQESLEKKKADSSKSNGFPREIASANSALKRNTSHQKPSNSENGKYLPPHSKDHSVDGGSRGLVRSHSSPNIAQMVNQEEGPLKKVPTVDRTLKPKATTPSHQSAELYRAKMRNLQPVYGHSSAQSATGLRNLGNTCFMNSIIQCLSNTIPLAEYFTSEQYLLDINSDNKQGTGGQLAEEFAVVIKALWGWMGQFKSFAPNDFKNTVSRCLSVCIGNEQQDSHEFLVVLMEKLHADLNKNSLRPVPKLESSVDENAFWVHHKKYGSSPIAKIFEGLLKSTLTCMSCHQTSDSFEVFSCLSLPILATRCSLKDCFQHFLKSEKISGEAAWDCPRCKQKKEADKRLHICRLPNILVIQLKRFSYEGLWRRKLATFVEFDHKFDVPYQNNSTVASKSYSLYGIVNHFGTLEGGHYTAYCKANKSHKKWYKYDDHEVTEISSSDIKTSAAYLLFYSAVDFHANL